MYIIAASGLVAAGAMCGMLAGISLTIQRDERAFRRHAREVRRRVSQTADSTAASSRARTRSGSWLAP
jgi:hypothetical protein